MGANVQSVVIRNSVFVGGGSTLNNDCDSYTVMKLDLQQDEWTKLPQYSATEFAMTSLANLLVLVGGVDQVTGCTTNQIALFVAGRWTRPFPPMTVARSSSTAVSLDNYIVVAGGYDNQYGYSVSVELYWMWCREGGSLHSHYLAHDFDQNRPY